MNIKKIINFCLGTLIVIFLLSGFYFYIQYKDIDLKLFKIIQNEITKQNPEFGYTFSSTFDGQITSHSPIDQYKKNSIDAIFDISSKAQILKAFETVKSKKTLLLKGIKDRHDHNVYLYLKTDNNQIIGFIFFPNELRKFEITEERHFLILLTLSFMFALCCLLVLITTFTAFSISIWWICVSLISCIMIGEMCYLWSLRDSVGFKEDLQAIPILSEEQESNFFYTLQKERNQSYIKIPTGIFINNGQFSMQGVSDIYPGIFLNGYIWQHYSLEKHTNIDRGFIISNAYSSTTEKLFHQIDGDEETICWSFGCSLYQYYNTLLYPFDHRHVTINLLHKNFEKNIILTPDFNSYDSIDSLMLPGISLKTVKFPHWNISKSFFNFGFFNFKNSLGYKAFEHNQIPYLQYIITMQRNVSGNFLMYFILFFVIFVILFILLTAFLRQGTLLDIVGFSTLSIVGSCSGLLFILITSEINLRQTLSTEGIVYLEFLYFICYFAIIGVIINSILFAKGKPGFIAYQDNLICKLLYWPLTLLSIVLVTAYALY